MGSPALLRFNPGRHKTGGKNLTTCLRLPIVVAFDRKAQRHWDTRVFEAQPFRLLKDSLPRHLADALAKLDACTPDFIALYGVQDLAG